MATMNENRKLWLIGGGAALVCALAGAGVFWTMGVIEETRLATEQKRAEVMAAEQKIAKIPSSEQEVIILRENLGDYVKILPDSRDLNHFVKMLNAFEQQAGIRAIEFKPGRAPRAAPGKQVERFSRIEYQYEFTATLWQFLRFVNFIENWERFVSITNFSIEAGGKAANEEPETRDGEVVHRVKLTMETYVYNAPNSGEDVRIPDYNDKRDNLREEIFKRLQAIRIDRYEHKGPQGRRDIFVDPRQRVAGPDGQPTVPVKDQKALIEQYVGEVQKVRELLQRSRKPGITIFEEFSLEKAMKDGLAQLQTRIDEVVEKGMISYQPLKLRWSREVLDVVTELVKEADEIGKRNSENAVRDAWMPETELTDLLASMTQSLEAGNLEDAKNRFELLQNRMGVPQDDPRRVLEVRAKALHVKAVTALEFRKLNLKIQGVMVNQEGRSGVLVNGQVFEEGEYVSDELVVKAVQEEQVTFVFRGLTLIRTL